MKLCNFYVVHTYLIVIETVLLTYSSIGQVLSYSCVYLYYAKGSGRVDYLSFIADALEGDTNALQALLGKSL